MKIRFREKDSRRSLRTFLGSSYKVTRPFFIFFEKLSSPSPSTPPPLLLVSVFLTVLIFVALVGVTVFSVSFFYFQFHFHFRTGSASMISNRSYRQLQYCFFLHKGTDHLNDLNARVLLTRCFLLRILPTNI